MQNRLYLQACVLFFLDSVEEEARLLTLCNAVAHLAQSHLDRMSNCKECVVVRQQ